MSSRIKNLRTIGHKLYTGEVEYDFVGRQKRWYTISLLIVIAAVVGLVGPGIKKSIEFTGGAVYTVTAPHPSTSEAAKIVAPYQGAHEPIIQKLGNDQVKIQTGSIPTDKANELKDALAKGFAVSPDKIDAQVVGPSWGKEISNKAIQGLIIFMILVVIYLAFAFEWRMAVAALVALCHDILITVGVYALVGFEVSPGTVIGLLTILGYSLYDTVVVFDTVKENTRSITKQNRWTYSEAANRGLNQTLVRSINTTVVALLPVASLLFVGGGLLGAGTLEDIALALFIGLAAGAYSSIFIATPLLADLKERDPQMKALRKRVLQRRAAEAKRAAEGGDQMPEGTDVTDDGLDLEDEVEGSDTVPGQAGGETAGAGAGRRQGGSRPAANRTTRPRGGSRPGGPRKRH